MGCSSSKEDNATGRPNRPVQLQPVHRPSNGASQRHPKRTDRPMTAQIRTELLNATHNAFGALDYGIIGGAALAEYGNVRATSDLDVMVPENISEVVERQLLSRGMVRTVGGGLGFIASDNRCYGLDITTDRAVGQTFRGARYTTRTARSPVRLMPIAFLLNSKAWSYMTRVGPDQVQKKANDAADIFFILEYMARGKMTTDGQECRWVVDYDFWVAFCRDFRQAEGFLKGLGLRRDATPNTANREARRSSSLSIHSIHSRAGSGR